MSRPGQSAGNLVLRLPKPLAHQRPVLDDPSDRKCWRAGRRTGKSIAGLVAATSGHGPMITDHANGQRRRLHRGMLDGGNIAWLTKTYKQSRVIWRRLLFRLESFEGTVVDIQRDEMRIARRGGRGAITVWSGHTRDAIDNLRGDAYDGVILDEAAYLDAEYAIKDVAQPALLDVGGWLFVFSTPNAGWDKNERREAPSYFNRLCQQIADELPGVVGWRHWHNRTEDNPKLSRKALEKLRAEYGDDSAQAQQELDALLVVGGLLAIPIDRDAALVPARVVPRHWAWFAALDWGYSHPYSVGLYAVNEAGIVTCIDTVTGRKDEPAEIAAAVRARLAVHGLHFGDLSYTVAGGDVFDEHGKSRGLSGATIAEQFRTQGWVVQRSSASGSHKRTRSLSALRTALKEERLRWFDTPDNRAVLRCLETRISDPNNPEDVLKQDADGAGRGGDDHYDQVRYAVFSRPTAPAAPVEVRDVVNRAEPLAARVPAARGVEQTAHARRPFSPRRYEEVA